MKTDKNERVVYETVYGIKRENGRWRVFTTSADPRRLKFLTTGHAEEDALKLLRMHLARERSKIRGVA